MLWAARRSKDPSTQVGACIIDAHSGGLFLGYNGFPAGWPDTELQWEAKTPEVNDSLGRMFYLTKYDLVIHAEVNAVRKALMAGVRMTDAVLVCTHLPCPQCFKDVVLANGIKRVVYRDSHWASQKPRDVWAVEHMAMEGGVTLENMKSYFQRRDAAMQKVFERIYGGK